VLTLPLPDANCFSFPTIASIFRTVGKTAVDQNSLDPLWPPWRYHCFWSRACWWSEHKMVKSAFWCFALLSAMVIDFELLGPTRASAASDCVTETDLVPPKGTRLIYKIDHATNRKCLYLTRIAPVTKVHRLSKPPIPREVRHLSESDQAALFLEFLRWKEKQSPLQDRANGTPKEPGYR
jgi:hypothetical protein